jgi:hypothetical protein
MFVTYVNNVLNGHSTLYFGPPAGLILFLKIVPGRMSYINISESLWTISPKINQELDGCTTLLLDDAHVLINYISTSSRSNVGGS